MSQVGKGRKADHKNGKRMKGKEAKGHMTGYRPGHRKGSERKRGTGAKDRRGSERKGSGGLSWEGGRSQDQLV